MIVIFNLDGSVYDSNFSDYVQQGSNGANMLQVAYVDSSRDGLSAYLVAERPNGTTITLPARRASFFCNGERYSGWEIAITGSFTLYTGVVHCTVNVVDEDDNIIANYPFDVTVNETGNPISGDWDEKINIAQYNEYMAQLSGKATVKRVDSFDDLPNPGQRSVIYLVGGGTSYGAYAWDPNLEEYRAIGESIYVVADITSADLSGYGEGQIIYDKASDSYYTKTDTSPYYELINDKGVLGAPHVLCRSDATRTIAELHDTYGDSKYIVLRHLDKDFIYFSKKTGSTYTCVAFDIDEQRFYKASGLSGSALPSTMLIPANKIEIASKSQIDRIDSETFKSGGGISGDQDLNDYVEAGSYWIFNGSQTNKPSDIGNGLLLVFCEKDTVGSSWPYTDVVFQIISDEASIKYIRRKYGSTWTSWRKIDGSYFKSMDNIYANEDFNDYTRAGSYWFGNSTMSNKPFNNNGSLLVFEEKDVSLDVVFQVAFNTDNQVSVRRKYGSTWTSWATFKNGFYNKGSVSSDFNNYTQEGSYFVPSGSITNKPGSDLSWNGILLVFSGTAWSYTFAYQIAIDQEGREFRRRCNLSDNSWTNWLDMSNFYKANNSVISGKKYYACGDSFTAQGYAESDPGYGTDSILQDGKYAGYNAVYPYYIGNRTNCDVHNVAAGGMTLATYIGGTNCFTYNNAYQALIPNDAELVTLYFGINDSHHNIPIGTIDDNTTDTFYGAWNTVLSWLLQNRPNAKIGVIISNGCDTTDYPTATINACKKWGVPYLDINGDDKLPMVIRANMRSGLSVAANAIWTARYRVSETNTHPNYKAHEDESYMIQQFLERL